jgi:tetratricopeptide (TPR) repeat protein
VLVEIGRQEEGLTYLKEALSMYAWTLGSDHTDTAIVMNNLASALRAMGKRDEALTLYEEAVRILERTAGPDNSLTKSAQSNLQSLERDSK